MEVAEAAHALRDAGALVPDGGSADSYAHSIAQWAVWTREKGFDRASFETAFLEHSRQNVLERGYEWTDAVARQARQLIPGRWEDVRRVLNATGETGAVGGAGSGPADHRP